MEKTNCKVKYYPNGTAKYTVFDKPVYQSLTDDDVDARANYLEKRRIAREMFRDDMPVQWMMDILDMPIPENITPMECDFWKKVIEMELFPNGVDERRERFGNEEVRDDNLKRAKDKLFDIALLNSDTWTHMVTFTLDRKKIDRYDREAINKKFKIWLNNMVKRKDFKYLIIPEYHEDGAVHFHGLINIGKLTLIPTGDIDKEGRVVYESKEYTLGRNWFVPLDKNCYYVAKYITKYITKDTKKIMGNFIIAVVD